MISGKSESGSRPSTGARNWRNPEIGEGGRWVNVGYLLSSCPTVVVGRRRALIKTCFCLIRIPEETPVSVQGHLTSQESSEMLVRCFCFVFGGELLCRTPPLFLTICHSSKDCAGYSQAAGQAPGSGALRFELLVSMVHDRIVFFDFMPSAS